MQVTNIHEAKARLSELIRRAIAGEEIYIAQADEPLVRLEPLSRDTRPRMGGQWKGRIVMSPGFDQDDDEIESSFLNAPLLTPSGRE